MEFDAVWFEAETRKHQQQVAALLIRSAQNLLHRAIMHDASKLVSPEREIFIEFTPKLHDLTYGSDEYKACLAQMKPALDHHYAVNSHHPECNLINGFNNAGFEVDGMNLFDLMEMICDWLAATLRHADGSIGKSIDLNQERFHMTDQVTQILRQTVGLLVSGPSGGAAKPKG